MFSSPGYLPLHNTSKRKKINLFFSTQVLSCTGRRGATTAGQRWVVEGIGIWWPPFAALKSHHITYCAGYVLFSSLLLYIYIYLFFSGSIHYSYVSLRSRKYHDDHVDDAICVHHGNETKLCFGEP